MLLLAVNPGLGRPVVHRRRPNAGSREARELVDGREIVLGVDGGITKANVAHVARSAST